MAMEPYIFKMQLQKGIVLVLKILIMKMKNLITQITQMNDDNYDIDESNGSYVNCKWHLLILLYWIQGQLYVRWKSRKYKQWHKNECKLWWMMKTLSYNNEIKVRQITKSCCWNYNISVKKGLVELYLAHLCLRVRVCYEYISHLCYPCPHTNGTLLQLFQVRYWFTNST